MKIIPPGMSFQQAVRAGLTGRILLESYLAWLRTLPCDTCHRPAPSEASHVNGFKGMGTKGPDPFSIPECSSCNLNYDRNPPEVDSRIVRAAFYLLRAIWERRLVWSSKPIDTVEVPRHFLEYLLRAVNYTGEGSPRIERHDAETIHSDVRRMLT